MPRFPTLRGALRRSFTPWFCALVSVIAVAAFLSLGRILDHADPNPVMAFFVVTGTLAVLFNLIADLVYAALDPRIKVG